MWFLLQKLRELRLLSVKTLCYLLMAIGREGANLMTLLYLAKRLYSTDNAFIFKGKEINYETFYSQCKTLAAYLEKHYSPPKGQKVAILARNHLGFVQSLFALSRLGADIYLLNVEMSKSQFIRLNEAHQFTFLVYDEELTPLIQAANYQGEMFLTREINTIIEGNISPKRLKRVYESKLIILSSGTTGNFKTAARKPSLFTFLSPFFALITQLNLSPKYSIYVALPLYHGFGLSALIMAMALGAEIHLTPKFEAEKAADLIHQYRLNIAIVVPLMLHRWAENEGDKLKSLQAIVSGGAQLSAVLYQQLTAKLGEIVYNLYGTSEAGFSIMATPKDLQLSPSTIGKPIWGVKTTILDNTNQPVTQGNIGNLAIQNRWAMLEAHNRFVLTGDLAYQDENGYFYLAGRADDMIVSGGENVYPLSLENKLLQHPCIEAVAVIGIPDEAFGQRLKAFILLKRGTFLSENELKVWLSQQVARFEMPKVIIFVDTLPYNALGKVNKRELN